MFHAVNHLGEECTAWKVSKYRVFKKKKKNWVTTRILTIKIFHNLRHFGKLSETNLVLY